SNLDQAIKWAHMGIFFNHGQCCTAGSRVYVQDSVYDEFLTKFKAYTESNKIGDPFEEDTYQGPQISQTQFDSTFTKFGLAAAVFTNDLTKVIKLSNELSAGTVW
ncbi:16679_t:CDS:2, partial [Gigaspora rosea]